jgi:hypothetical protein
MIFPGTEQGPDSISLALNEFSIQKLEIYVYKTKQFVGSYIRLIIILNFARLIPKQLPANPAIIKDLQLFRSIFSYQAV